jgi:ribonuclease P protein component
LRAGRDIREVLKGGQRSQDGLFSMHARPNGLPHARLALAVSRRVSLKAVVRNRIKRLVRESFRQTQATLPGLDIVVVARSTAGTTEPAKLRLSLERLWPLIRQRCNACSSP